MSQRKVAARAGHIPAQMGKDMVGPAVSFNIGTKMYFIFNQEVTRYGIIESRNRSGIGGT